MLLGGAWDAARSPSSPFWIKWDRFSGYIRVVLKCHFWGFAFSGQFEWMSCSRFKVVFSSLCPPASHSVLSHVAEDHPGAVPKMWFTERGQIRYACLRSPPLPLTPGEGRAPGSCFPLPLPAPAFCLSFTAPPFLPPTHTHALRQQMSGHPPKAKGTGRP